MVAPIVEIIMLEKLFGMGQGHGARALPDAQREEPGAAPAPLASIISSVTRPIYGLAERLGHCVATASDTLNMGNCLLIIADSNPLL